MYTEEEAKEKVCPEIIGDSGRSITNKCISSDCMAWRWAQRETRMTGDDVAYVKVGYCGLAGKP
jgi:hypothetical protein